MNLITARYLLPLLLVLPINGTDLSENGTLPESRIPRASRRVVRLYSGTRPKPIVCLGEGFQADPSDCTIFHRCMKNGNGRYISFRFQCGPGTIYDPESEICNHPHKTKRTDCGGRKPIFVPNIELPYDNDISKEVPSPISTRDPGESQKTPSLGFSNSPISNRDDMSTSTIKYQWSSTKKHYSDFFIHSTNQLDKTTKVPPTKRQVSESSSVSTTFSWMSSHKNPTTPRIINRQTTSQSGELCTSEGFMGDSENCRKFYRCISNQRGGFIRYEFLCSDPTIWDDDAQACNHVWSVKRRRCGRGSIIESNELKPTNKEKKEPGVENLSTTAAPNSSQNQLQINYGSKVTQTQTQISNGSVIQNQTQINYGPSAANQTTQSSVLQNQTQISHGSAISQTQTQINYGDKAMQTQLQIDHSKETSQAQTQLSESTSTTRTTQYHEAQSTSSVNTNNACTTSGFMGDSEDCKKFYRCVDNGRGSFTRYEFSCGEGTVWDANVEACNHAWAVKECGGKAPMESSSQSITKTTEQVTTSKPAESSSLSTTTTTQGYYSSTDEDVDENNDIGYGNQPSSLAPTTSKPETQQTTTTKAPQTSNNNSCKSSGFMGDNSDCKKFYRCVDNGNGGYTRYEFSCGEGTVWDQKIEACNHAWAVENCGGNAGSSTTASSVQTTSNEKTSQIPAHNDDYDTGYGSQHDEPQTTSTTPHTTVLTTTIKSSSTVPPQSSQEASSNTGNDCTSSGFMGDNNDCKKFYRCVDNGNGGYTRYEFSCGEGTVWDPKIQACNHPWAVEKCGGIEAEDINKVETTTKRDESVSTSTVTSSISQMTEPDDDNDVGYGQPSSLPQQSTSTSSRPQSQDSDSNECKSSGFMGDKNDCKKFYRCVDNGDGSYKRYEFACGEGTVWDSKIDACNHAWAVENCGSSSSSQTSKPTQSIADGEESIDSYPVQSDEYSTQSTSSMTTLASLTSSTTTTVSNADNSCKASGFMADSTDCKKFYRCVEDGQGGYIRYEFSCGEGTVWDPSIDACNHAWAVKGQCSQSGPLNESNNDQSTTQPSAISHETDPDDQEYNKPTTQKTSTTASITSKPTGNQCKHEGFYGDENNCKNFYRCVDNGQGGFTKYEFTCGEGTVWSQDIQACDHESTDKKCSKPSQESSSTKPDYENEDTAPTTIDSESSPTSNENNYISEKPQTSENNCKSDGFYGDSNDCKKFYRCVDDGKGGFTKYDFACGDGTVWDQEILACNHEDANKNCADKTGSTSQATSSTATDLMESSTSSQIQQTTHQPETNISNFNNDKCDTEGFFANSHDCKKFYRCVSDGKGGFTKYDFSCGEGTVWVQEIQACDYDNGISSCSNNNSSTNPQTTEEQQPTTSGTTTTSKYTTQSNEPNKEDDEYVGSSSSKPPAESDKCTSEGFYPNKNDCAQFHRCVDNGQGGYTKYDFTCGEGTAWDANIQTCNHISDVDSCRNTNEQENQSKPINDEESSQSPESESTTKGSTSTTESTKPSSEDKCNQEGYFGNTKDCTKFYRCVDNGKGGLTKYDFTCGEGTIWDQDLTTCNHPQDVSNPSCNNTDSTQSTSDSSSSTESTGSSSSSSTTTQSSENSTEDSNQSSSNCSQESTTKKPSKVKCEKAGFYADPDDCKKFYRCVDWDGDGKRFSVYHFDCGEGTIWDPQLETCNHEDSVYPPRDCSGTQSENVAQETPTTEESTASQDNTTTDSTTVQSSTEESTSEQTTQQSSTTEKTTTTQQTSSEQTTKQSTTEKSTTTTQQTTSSEKTTQQSTTEATTTEQTSTTQQQTTEESTPSQQTTTQQSTSSEPTTTQQSSTSEKTTTQKSTTSEQTTTEQTTSSEQTTQQSSSSEQTTQQSSSSENTTQQPSNTDETTTEQQPSTTDQTTSTTEQSNAQNTTEQTSTESTTEQGTTGGAATTTESTESTTTESEQSTTSQESSSEKECPETDDDQYLYVCPTSFRRHPKYCNMFYQCTEDDNSHEVKIATFKCPNNTIYDESKTQCVEEEKADKKCNGQIARKYRVKRLNIDYKEPIEAGNNKHTCSAVGYYPFETDECSGAFLKCRTTKSGKLRGYVHRCPEGYIYWSVSKRCEKETYMKDCKRSPNIWKDRWEIPIEKKNLAK